MPEIIKRFWSGRPLICIFSILLVIVACTSVDATVPAATENAQEPVSTLRPTRTAEPPTLSVPALPSNTAEPATLNPTSIPTPAPTQSRRPTALPSPTATLPFPKSFTFPAWVWNPDSAVLLVSLWDDARQNNSIIYLLNVATGENFEIFSSEDGWKSYWYENEMGLNIRAYYPLRSGSDPDHYYLHQVDIMTGEEHQLPLSTIYCDCWFSPDGRFTTQKVGELGAESVVIIDQATGQEISLADPFDGRYPDSIDLSWSFDSMLLAARYHDFDEVNPAIGLAIYTTDGRLYRAYPDVWNWAWAADGSHRILSIEGIYGNNGDPCILDLETNITECLSELTNWREENGIEKTGYYEWLPDGSGISFLYWNRAGERETGLCIIDISSREITCPINETHIFSAAIGPEVGGFPYLIGHQWSPDGHYIALAIDPFGPESDDRTLTQIATIARDGTQFHVWGFAGLWEAEWRPLLEPTED